MEATLHALGGILLKAVPTFLLIVLLHFYLKKVFFKPLERVLEKRYEATEGTRRLSQQSLERAAAKTAEYEAAMRAARAEVYQAQDRLHKRLQDEETEQVREARASADSAVKQAQTELAADVEQAKVALAPESDSLAGQIAETVMRRSAA
jgi:F-type H+-transporting ATPase subunit b